MKIRARIARWWHCLRGMHRGCRMVTLREYAPDIRTGPWVAVPMGVSFVGCSCGWSSWETERGRESFDSMRYATGWIGMKKGDRL